VAQLKEQVEALEADELDLREKIAELEQLQAEAVETVELKAKLAELKQALKLAEKHTEVLQQKVEQHEQGSQAKPEQILQLEGRLEAADKKRAETEKRAATMLQQLQAQVSEHREKIKATTQEKQQLEDITDELEADAAELREKLQQEQQLRKDSDKQVLVLEDQLEALENEPNADAMMVQQLQVEVGELKQEAKNLAQLKAKHNEQKESLTEMEELSESLQENLVVCKGQLVVAKKEIKSLTEDLDACKLKLASPEGRAVVSRLAAETEAAGLIEGAFSAAGADTTGAEARAAELEETVARLQTQVGTLEQELACAQGCSHEATTHVSTEVFEELVDEDGVVVITKERVSALCISMMAMQTIAANKSKMLSMALSAWQAYVSGLMNGADCATRVPATEYMNSVLLELDPYELPVVWEREGPPDTWEPYELGVCTFVEKAVEGGKASVQAKLNGRVVVLQLSARMALDVESGNKSKIRRRQSFVRYETIGPEEDSN